MTCSNDTFYVINNIKSKIAALAYGIEAVEEKTFEISDKETIVMQNSILGIETEYDENGEIHPLIFDLSKLVALISMSDDFPEDFEFQFPVKEVTSFKIDDITIYKIKADFMLDPDIEGTLYVSDKVLKTGISEGEPIRGNLWMQRFLAD